MAFKINDLMISDLSEIPYLQRPLATCPRSFVLCVTTCTPAVFDPGEALETLEALREHLEQQMEAIEQQLQPQTAEEVNDLSAKLTAAVEALAEYPTSNQAS